MDKDLKNKVTKRIIRVFLLANVILATVFIHKCYALDIEQDHTDVVVNVKKMVIAAGINPDESECARFEITNRVVILLASQGYCLLSKPSGNNCKGFAVDSIINKNDGQVVDILGAGNEGPNTPHWILQDKTNPNRCSPAIPLVTPSPPDNPSHPSPGPTQEPSTRPEDEDNRLALARIENQLELIKTLLAQLSEKEAQDTEKIQQQIDQVVKNAEKSAPGFAAKLVQLITLGLAGRN